MAQESQTWTLELQRYREFLCLLARLQLGARLRGKLDLSGVVQQTMLEVHQSAGKLRTKNEKQKAAWLRQALANNLRDEIRKLDAAARDVARERSLEAELEQSSARIANWLAAEQSSPSHRVMREEQLLALADGLAQLPDDQRQVVELHHLEGLPLADVARSLNRTKGAVAALLFRALKKLRALLAIAAEE